MISSVILTAVFLLVGVLTKYFKFYWLIAGYNTSSEEYKKNVDIIGLSKFIGNGCFIIAIVLLIGGILSYLNVSYAYPISVGCITIVSIFMAIKSEKYDRNNINDIRKNRRITKSSLLFIIIFSAVVGSFVIGVIASGSKEPDVNLVDNEIRISGNYGTQIKVTDIDKVSLLNTLPNVNRKKYGFDFGNTLRGDFYLDNYGDSKLYIFRGKQPYVYIYSSDGKVTIINFKDSKKTEKLYNDIMNYLHE